MHGLLTVLQVLISVGLVGSILVQAGKGRGLASAFGGSGSGVVFGGRGAGTFLTKLTAILAAVFLVICLVQGMLPRETLSERQSATLSELERRRLESSPAAALPFQVPDAAIPMTPTGASETRESPGE
jgi:preprotein translocase subunit SecG